ncbi:AsmA family protein [Chitinophagaceae bacterium LB-8]|uniref:AsmA family protein n=1 Tax=Paraflavisolibacter caeni TaxID=2982496 RepID=A0A9X2XTP2_9BACT|nr:AsmA-like C-terminal region-containing protein [Paraflavisolibacter caeni]MCU7548162.1 AsmA family protein [Paraflavisolibacter caeni]
MKKILTISGITIGSILLLMFLLPVLFPGFVADKIKKWANNAITTELNFSKARLSFFNHFPSLTLTLYDISVMGSAPYSKDTLLNAGELALGIDLSTLFSELISIDEIYFTEANIFIKINAEGAANYNVYKSDTTHSAASPDSSGTSLKIERIQIDNSNLVYDDLSIPLLIKAQNLDYVGKGDLSKAIFDLSSNIQVKTFDFDYNFGHYINSKTLRADLVTKINTNSLAFEFTKNDLLINSLPVDFVGKFELLQQGYNIDFELNATKGDLHDVFSALPPEYMDWFSKTKLGGKTEIQAYLKGKYIAEQNLMPDLGFKMTIREGYINNQNVPSPVKNLFLNFDSKLPSLNTDSLYVNIDSIFFNIDKDYFSSIIKLKNLSRPELHAKINSEMDLEKWDRAFGVQPFDVKGKYRIHFTADGKYETAVVQKGRRGTDTIITNIPAFNLQSSLTNGYFKLTSLPQDIKNISFKLNASNSDGNYKHTDLSIEQLNANMLSDYIKGYFRLNDLTNVDADLKALLHLGNIKNYYPLESIDIAGDLNLDVILKGKYLPDQKQFPVTKANINLQNGYLKTSYYPHPIEKIQLRANAITDKGTLADMQFELQPISFLFEGQPFTIKADLENFEDLKYDITSSGTLDIGRIYQVFSQEGLNVEGTIKTNLKLQGLQSDATAGRYNRLNNSGTAELQDITLYSNYFPLPFMIKTGLFRFENEKTWFEKFNAVYGKTGITLNGYLFNIVNYAMQENAPLKGSFDLNTKHFYVDEFMAYAGDTTASPADSSGVVIIPSNFDITFNVAANKVTYDSLEIQNFKGGMAIANGKLILNKTGFELINAPIEMDATYASISPRKASFEYHIKADSFDIKRAYNEIRLFHDLASSASKTEGIVSLDYKLSGKLDANMEPIYPSLKGGGVMSLHDVKVNGLKLFSAVSKATNKDSVNNPNLRKVDIKTSIANNIITLQRTKMKVFGFHPRFEGQVSFDGKLNLTGRLGLPPFGIIGIPFTVVGTQENPQVKLRRSKDSDKIEESTEEPDEEVQPVHQ